ncbi:MULTISPECIES: N-acetyltransferase [Paraburkholderia]|uniref:GNAT family N-acetyltransferase n=1 Tax=Paraburkholderia TaxID=1822464 RepID=UPI002254814C|nr:MULTISPECIES: GNAT family N-acetyltransferase [Paraburkholderia]MCX4165706.1 GNAT family N-acetyltransferase [Paraburkholderia megapolitana]MDN7161197.1 GNAT family N-acetyltransferase [Paraburkholderia sp. CHISQ3]MDQ6498244.1 GNAT family N-acetyltransferase [Paraburkholderia megapolitana]
MSYHLNIRVADGAEIAQLAQLDPIALRDEKRKAFIGKAVEMGHCWIATDAHDQRSLLGYGILNHSFFEQNFIALVVVKENARRQGVATAIIKALEAQCCGNRVFTSTNASNMSMRGLLDRLGYTGSGQIDNLDAGDPELVFVKLITS